MTEADILEDAITAFNHNTGLELTVTVKNELGEYRTDALALINYSDTPFYIVVKKWLNQTHPGTLLRHLDALKYRPNKEALLLVTDYVNPNLANRLREEGIQFIDTVGNAYIKNLPVYVDVQGKKANTTNLNRVKNGKAFQPKGLRLVYALLTQPDLINKPFREMQSIAGIALGTVKQVVDDLTAQGFINNQKGNRRQLDNRNKLVEKWVEAYPTALKAKLITNTFVPTTQDWYNKDITLFKALWAGDVAADRYTHYLTPQDEVIFVNRENQADLIKALRLRKARAHETEHQKIEFVTPFIDLNYLRGDYPDIAHPILVYANLLATADTRAIETAKILYENHIN